MGMLGAGQASGPTLMQACATSMRTLLAAQEIEVGMASAALVLNCDRTSNGPHLYYPNPRGTSISGATEDW
jgi:acetyl-CoA acetyltransferase